MAVIMVIPWLSFSSGLLAGCWVGVIVGGAIALLFASRRLRQLESSNVLLRLKLRAEEKGEARARRNAAGSLLTAHAPGRGSRPTRFAAGGR